jgi:hypothetical protein
VEPLLLLSPNGEERKPDIVASAASGWVVLELSFNDTAKEGKLREYSQIDHRYLGQYGLISHTSPPDVLSSRLRFVEDGPFCQLVVSNRLDVVKDERIANDDLRRALVEARGTDLTQLPSLPFTLVPEMVSHPQEIREGLVGLILQIFAPGSAGIRASELVDKGLERLADAIGPKDKSTLISKVEEQMKTLLTGLGGYLEESERVVRASAKWKDPSLPKQREWVAMRIKMWVAKPSLPDFFTDDSPQAD